MRKGLAFACMWAAAACSGSASPSDDGNGGGNGDSGGTGGTTTPEPSLGTFVPGPAGLRYLTRQQYRNSVQDLLGVETTVALADDQVVSGFASIAAARNTLPTTTVEAFETSALSVAAKSLQDKTKRTGLVTCTPKGTSDDDCAATFVKVFGRRAWRRPLTDDEVKRYVDVAHKAADTLSDFHKGLEYAVAGLLQSPYFLYRSELGRTDAGSPNGSRRLDVFELATRLSYFVLNTTPDDELLSAAQSGGLDDAAGVSKQMDRLLESDRATRAPRAFFGEMLGLEAFTSLRQTKDAYPKSTDTLAAAMREETLRSLENAFSKGKSWPEMFTSRDTFLNEELANLYGIKGVTGKDLKAFRLPDDGKRIGLLGHGSFLASHSSPTASSPTKRGVAIRQTLMCDDIPAPPPDVSAVVPPNEPNQEQKTLRERLTAHRDNPKCRSCHEIIDPVGLALENFDGLGEYRVMDAGKVIDASGTLDDEKFDGAAGLSIVLSRRPQVTRCLLNNLFRFALGHVETEGELPALTHLSQMWDGKQNDIKALFPMLAAHDSFTHVTPTAAEGNQP